MSEAHTPSSESLLAVAAAAAVLEMLSTFGEDMNTHIDAGEVVALLIEACCSASAANCCNSNGRLVELERALHWRAHAS